jgi:cytosine/adenosine deaminase-related metal-dependent hydrolase
MNTPSAEPWTLTARWVFPVDGPPLEGGTVTVAGRHLVAVEPHGRSRANLDLGDAAILPGLVNAHTHLDLTGLRGRVPYQGSFTDWLSAVIAHRRALSPAQVEQDVLAGVRESLTCGVTLVGDVSGGGLSWHVLANSALRAVVFHELLGLPRERAGRAWAEALAWLRTHTATPTCRPGLSPHAPYSVRAGLFRAAGRLAAERDLPLTIHLAETCEEAELLARRAGPFVGFLDNLGVFDPEGLVGGLGEVAGMNVGVPHVLYAHGNYLDPGTALGPGATVVYCPRTHAYFRHAPHPYRELLRRGVRIALGTDSLASSPDLSVLEEARFLHRHDPDLPGSLLLEMITRSAAEALGWGEEAGTLVAGKSADLVVLPIPPGQESDPHRLVFDSDLPVRDVLCGGEWVTR